VSNYEKAQALSLTVLRLAAAHQPSLVTSLARCYIAHDFASFSFGSIEFQTQYQRTDVGEVQTFQGKTILTNMFILGSLFVPIGLVLTVFNRQITRSLFGRDRSMAEFQHSVARQNTAIIGAAFALGGMLMVYLAL